jgi:hypothetical protein
MTGEGGTIPRLGQFRKDASGVIGVLAQRGDQIFALTARHLLEPIKADPEHPVQDGISLIGMIPLPPEQAMGGKAAEGGCADPDQLLGQSVYRFCADGRAPGKVTALHGALRLKDTRTGTSFICADMIEVSFDETRASGPEADRVRTAMSPLGALDAGTLVITWENQAAGIVIAGAGHRAYLAPLQPFLEAHDLTLGASPALTVSVEDPISDGKSPGLLTLACASFVDDLAREPGSGIELPEAA